MRRFFLLLGWLMVTPLSAEVIESAKNGSWSSKATWKDGRIPSKGDKVHIRSEHTVTYDVKSSKVIRSLHIAGILTFATDRDTLLEVGLIRIHAGDDLTEEGFEAGPDTKKTQKRAGVSGQVQCLCCEGKAALLVGTSEKPISRNHTAIIRLHYIPGMDKKSCPAIVCCSGRMDFHGATMKHTWLKLGKYAYADDDQITTESATDWHVGDRILITDSYGNFGALRPETEERFIKSIRGKQIILNKPLRYDHRGTGELRAEVANLSRNVIVESANPDGIRGHTMYHVKSSGSISYAEFRHLGKRGILGRYPIHYHLCKDTMRGSSVIGASIWDSDNRWVTIHGTEYIVVRDCVGYRSIGHGYFLEDGTEVMNVLDRNLAVLAEEGEPLEGQMLPFDKNEGAGFWWANSYNTFTRNVAVDCAGYGFRYEATPNRGASLNLPVLTAKGNRERRDIRTLPFVRFERNEAHNIANYGLNMGQDAGNVGPGTKHPFVIREMKIWNAQRGYTVHVPYVRIDDMLVHRCGYEVYRARYHAQDYRNVRLSGIRGRGYVSNVKEYLTTGQLVKEQGVGLTRARLPGYPRGTGAGGNSYRPSSYEVAKLEPVDDQPPITVISSLTLEGGKLRVRGTTSDNGKVKQVLVNGQLATAIDDNFAQWEITLDGKSEDTLTLSAHAEDEKGNVESLKHALLVSLP